MSGFDADAVRTLFDKVMSYCMGSGLFETVNSHEPKSAPANGLNLALWIQYVGPVQSSGLSSTSGTVRFTARLYSNMLQEPADAIDPSILSAVTTLLTTFSGDFDFGATVRQVDLLGAYGPSLSAQAGYLNLDGRLYRVMDITVPVIINDMWPQA